MRPFWIVFIIQTLIFIDGYSQKNLFPSKTYPLDYSHEKEMEFNEKMKSCDSILSAVHTEEIYESLTEEQKNLIMICDVGSYNYYDASEPGCSWYCGGGPDTIYASSNLRNSKYYSYEAENIFDDDHFTAWVEGAKGNGIGEWIIFSFAYYSPRITQIGITNGYVKTEKAYLENCRVKKIKVLYEGKIWGYLNLEDMRSEQWFDLDTLGHSTISKELNTKENWELKLEIVEVYPGSKYNDLAITDIQFDGIDVHCLAKGTKVLMSDSSLKNIEALEIGDIIISYNETKSTFERDTVLALEKVIHHELFRIEFDDQSQITITDDHPMWQNEQWVALNPFKSNHNYSLSEVKSLDFQSKIQGKEINTITKILKVQETYTISKLTKNQSFIANGIIVSVEIMK